MPSSRGSSLPRDQTRVSCGSCIVGRFLFIWATRVHIDNYLKCKWIQCTNQKTETDWVDENMCMYALSLTKTLCLTPPNPNYMYLSYFVKLIMFPLWIEILITFYFLSGSWWWKLVNIFYYCDYVIITHFSSVQFSSVAQSVVSDSLRPHELQHARPPCPSPTPGFYPNSCPPSRRCHPAISSVVPFPPSPNPSQHQGLFQWVNSSHEVAKVLEFQLLHHSFQRNPRVDLLPNGLVGSPCSPRDSQVSSPTPQFKNFSSSMLSFLYSPTLASIHDYWKNHSLD